MLGGYNWGGLDISRPINYGGDENTVTQQNFGGHDVVGGNGVIEGLLDLEAEALPQHFGDGVDETCLDPASRQTAAADRLNEQRFAAILEAMEDLYSFPRALEVMPELLDYFGTPQAEGAGTRGPRVADVRKFLGPASLGVAGGAGLVLGLSDWTLENPPKPVDELNRSQVITPAELVRAFEQKDAFSPKERYYARRNIIACLRVLAEFQEKIRHPEPLDVDLLIRAVQQQRLASSVDYQVSLEAGNVARDQADADAHKGELARRTLERLLQGVGRSAWEAEFKHLELQVPGDPATLAMAADIQAGDDQAFAGKLARLTLDQLANLIVELNAEWRLPFKTAICDAAADYLAVNCGDMSAGRIDATMGAVLDWARGSGGTLPDAGEILSCVPAISRRTILSVDAETNEVQEKLLQHAQDPLLPSAVAKALKAHSAGLEHLVGGLIGSARFYQTIYRQGARLSSALNLHGMYLQCSNPMNRNMAFQTPAQFNHPDMHVRYNSGLYINVNRAHHPALECREAPEVRLSYIDKLWSLFRVIVLEEIGAKLATALASDCVFQAETDPERKRARAHRVLDHCARATFDGAAGQVTGITRDILVDTAMQNAHAEPTTGKPRS